MLLINDFALQQLLNNLDAQQQEAVKNNMKL